MNNTTGSGSGGTAHAGHHVVIDEGANSVRAIPAKGNSLPTPPIGGWKAAEAPKESATLSIGELLKEIHELRGSLGSAASNVHVRAPPALGGFEPLEPQSVQLAKAPIVPAHSSRSSVDAVTKPTGIMDEGTSSVYISEGVPHAGLVGGAAEADGALTDDTAVHWQPESEPGTRSQLEQQRAQQETKRGFTPAPALILLAEPLAQASERQQEEPLTHSSTKDLSPDSERPACPGTPPGTPPGSFSCDYQCGFRGSFTEVSEHERFDCESRDQMLSSATVAAAAAAAAAAG
jgi:hypothetical protein